MKDFVTLKTTQTAKKLLRLICALTGEKQFEVLERLLQNEVDRLKKKEISGSGGEGEKQKQK